MPRDTSICISDDSAWYNKDAKVDAKSNNSQGEVIMTSHDDEDFDRGKQIPGFSFFGVKDYMSKADAKKSVLSTNAAQ